MKQSSKLGFLGALSVLALVSTLNLPSVTVGGISFMGNQALAQDDAKTMPPQKKLTQCKSPPEKRRLKSLGQKFFKKVADIDELMNPTPDEKTGEAAEPDYKAAWPKLKKLIDRCDDCDEYEWAQLYQRAAFLQFQLENTPAAIDYFKKVVSKSPNIPESLETSLLYQIAQLLTAEERYDEALKTFDKWEAMCPKVVPEDYYYYRAQIYYQSDKKDEALKAVSYAIDFKEKLGSIPKERWLKLKLAIYADREDYKNAEKVAEKIAVHYTNLKSVGHLAQIYGVNGKEKEQLALSDALLLAGGFTKEREYRNLGYLYLSADAPYLASRVFAKGFKEEKMERTSKNLEVYAASLSQAQEVEEALPIMEEAASKSDEGKLYSTLAAIYLDAEKFDKAISAGKKALNKGVKNEGEVHMFMGSAYMYMEEYDAAITALRKALRDDKYEKYAEKLIAYVKSQKKRDEELRKAKLKI